MRSAPFLLRDSRASEMRARVKNASREKGKTGWGERSVEKQAGFKLLVTLVCYY